MSWFAALRDSVRAGLKVDRTLSSPKRALRGAVAAALVVFPTLALAGPGPATSAAMGAFIAGTATFQRSFRPRASLAVAAGIGLGVSTFCGYLAVGIPGAFPVLLAVWAFAAGLAWSIGPSGGVVASTTVSVMLVVVQLPVSVPTALGHGLLCALGGGTQALVVTLWPIESWRAQRDALADTYAELAHYARRLRQDPVAHVDPAPFILARQAAALTPGRPGTARPSSRDCAASPNASAPPWPRSPTPRSALPPRAPNGTGPGRCWPPPPRRWTRWPGRSVPATRSGCPSPPPRSPWSAGRAGTPRTAAACSPEPPAAPPAG
ncbi:FUSC family membrane protein [Kitasatospora gansuensis]